MHPQAEKKYGSHRLTSGSHPSLHGDGPGFDLVEACPLLVEAASCASEPYTAYLINFDGGMDRYPYPGTGGN